MGQVTAAGDSVLVDRTAVRRGERPAAASGAAERQSNRRSAPAVRWAHATAARRRRCSVDDLARPAHRDHDGIDRGVSRLSRGDARDEPVAARPRRFAVRDRHGARLRFRARVLPSRDGARLATGRRVAAHRPRGARRARSRSKLPPRERELVAGYADLTTALQSEIRGDTLTSQAKYPSAQAHYAAAVARDSGDAESWYGLADAYWHHRVDGWGKPRTIDELERCPARVRSDADARLDLLSRLRAQDRPLPAGGRTDPAADAGRRFAPPAGAGDGAAQRGGGAAEGGAAARL